MRNLAAIAAALTIVLQFECQHCKCLIIKRIDDLAGRTQPGLVNFSDGSAGAFCANAGNYRSTFRPTEKYIFL